MIAFHQLVFAQFAFAPRNFQICDYKIPPQLILDMEQYLKDFYDEEITNLLNDANDAVHVSINVRYSMEDNSFFL